MGTDLHHFRAQFLAEALDRLSLMEDLILSLRRAEGAGDALARLEANALAIKSGAESLCLNDVAVMCDMVQRLGTHLQRAARPTELTDIDALLAATDVITVSLRALRDNAPLDEDWRACIQRRVDALLASQAGGRTTGTAYLN